MNTGGIVEAGYLGSGKLALAGLAFGGNGTLYFGDLANYVSDVGINVTGTDGLNPGANTLTVMPGVIPGIGTYKLINYSGSIGGGFGQYPPRHLAQPRGRHAPEHRAGRHTRGLISLNVTGVDSVKWTGGTTANWDNVTAGNWMLGSNSGRGNLHRGR